MRLYDPVCLLLICWVLFHFALALGEEEPGGGGTAPCFSSAMPVGIAVKVTTPKVKTPALTKRTKTLAEQSFSIGFLLPSSETDQCLMANYSTSTLRLHRSRCQLNQLVLEAPKLGSPHALPLLFAE